MSRHLFVLSLSCLLLIFTAFTPHAASAEGEPTPEPVQPPWITGQNTEVTTGSEPAIASEPAGVVVDSPELVGLAPQDEVALSGKLVQLAVPQRTQDPDDPTCGAAALGMALEFLSFTEGGESPGTETLIKDLDSSGLLYDTGTGVEELAYIARAYGYRGASPFHGWTLEELAGELAAGRPAVVSLGLNGEDQPGHFVTVTGMAADGSWVTYNDPVLGEQTLSGEEFLAAWGSQGYSGLTVQKGALAAASDLLLPWLGLLGAVSTLAGVAKQHPQGNHLKQLLSVIQTALGRPSRQGLGGKLEPIYEWKQVQDGTKLVTDTSKKILKYGTRWVQRGWKRVTDTSQKIIEYGTRWVQRGWKTVKDCTRKIYQYGTRWVQQGWKKVTSWARGLWGWFKKTKWVPKMVKEKFITGWKFATKKVPNMVREKYVMGWHYATKVVPNMVCERYVQGWHYATKVVPNYVWKKVQVGWKEVEPVLNKNTPTPQPAPTPVVNPTPTPPLPSQDPASNPVLPADQETNDPTLRQKISDPLWWQSLIKKIANNINDQHVYSLSASDKWEIDIYSQAGALTQTRPYNVLYLSQKLQLENKLKVTGNPGSVFDFDLTSQTITMKISDNVRLSGSKLGGTVGLSQKRTGEMGHDYVLETVSIGWGPYGPTLTYRQEGVDLLLVNEEENFNVKNISYLTCETNTFRTEGLLLIGGLVVLGVLIGPEIIALGGLPEAARLIPVFGH